jgi:hypothetical protein
MKNDAELEAIAKALQTIRRESLRAWARMKAIETILSESMTEEQRDAWYRRLNEFTKHAFQNLLEKIEDGSPSAAAGLDDREDWEFPWM